MFQPLHWWIEHLQGATAGVDVVMGEIRKAFENVERVLVPGSLAGLHVASMALRTERPERRALPPLSGLGVTLNLLSARTK